MPRSWITLLLTIIGKRAVFLPRLVVGDDVALEAIERAGAVHFERRTGNIGGGGREQEDHRRGDLALGAHAAGWRLAGDAGKPRAHRLGIGLEAARINDPRRDRVDVDAV